MERFWRTLREQCLDFIGTASSLHDVRVRLVAFADEYHRTPHSGLMGECPGTVVSTEAAKPIEEKELRDALTTSVRRRVRTDSTLSISGKTYQVREAFLGGASLRLASMPSIRSRSPSSCSTGGATGSSPSSRSSTRRFDAREPRRDEAVHRLRPKSGKAR